jgi:hypothetical protein
MSPSGEAPFDVFISHHAKDREWVATVLEPRLIAAGFKVAVTYRDSPAGGLITRNIEQLIEGSRRTVAVITPDWLGNEWNAFEELLTRRLDPLALRRRLIPLLVKPCELPTQLAALQSIDLTTESRWVAGIKKLTRDLTDSIPVPPPWRPVGNISVVTRWWRWLYHYRLRVGLASLGLITIWLAFSLLLNLPPFQLRTGWQTVSPYLDDAAVLYRAGDRLLVASTTENVKCKPTINTGFWVNHASETDWNAIVVPELEFTLPGGECQVAAFMAFAHAPQQPETIFGATSNVGLLRSDNAGENWQRVGNGESLPADLSYVVVDPADPNHLYISGARVGVFSSLNGGKTWSRVDGADTCASADAGDDSLPEDFLVGAMLHTVDGVYIGNGESAVRADGGLYFSQDGGLCWRKVDSAQGKYLYRFLAEIPDQSGRLIVLTRDVAAQSDDEVRGGLFDARQEVVWLADQERGRVQEIASIGNTPDALWVSDEHEPRWYIATDQAQLKHGDLQGHAVQTTPCLTSCVLSLPVPFVCAVDLAPDAGVEMPLMLANGHVYRRGMVTWDHWLWPPGFGQ